MLAMSKNARALTLCFFFGGQTSQLASTEGTALLIVHSFPQLLVLARIEILRGASALG